MTDPGESRPSVTDPSPVAMWRQDDLTHEPAAYPEFDGSQPCLEVDGDLFFPEVGDGGTLIAQTVAVCLSCSFMADCLDYALANDVAGIWGGTTALKRRELRRRYGIRARVVSAARFLPTEARVAS